MALPRRPSTATMRDVQPPSDPLLRCVGERVNVDDLFGAMVAYEMFALASGRVPPITRLCRKQRLLCLPVVAVILAHLAKECP